MPTREEKIAFIQSKMGGGKETQPITAGPSREEKIAFIQQQMGKKLEPEESLPRRLARSTIDTVVPLGSAAAFGLAATPESAGLATIPAGAMGYAAGKQAARLLKHYVLGDPLEDKDLKEIVTRSADDLNEGFLVESGGHLAGKAIQSAAPLAKRIGGYAEKEAAKAVGAGAKEFENVAQAKRIGRNALDEKIVGPYMSAEQSLQTATRAKERAGQSMEQVFKKIDEGVGPSVNPIDTAVKVETELAPTYRTPINKSEVTQLENTLESILARGESNISLSQAQALKKEIDSVAFPKGKKPVDPTPKQQMAMDASRIIKDTIEEAAGKGAEAIGSKDLIEQFAQAKKSYGLNKQTEKLLTKKVGKEGADIGTKINWTVDPVKFAASVAKKVGPNMSATKAITADKMASQLRKIPQLADLEIKEPGMFQAIVSQFARSPEKVSPRKAADQEESVPTKGRAKWIASGTSKLIEHSPEADSIVSQLKGNPKAQDLLVQASDLSPGSKSMDQVLTKIKELQKGKN